MITEEQDNKLRTFTEAWQGMGKLSLHKGLLLLEILEEIGLYGEFINMLMTRTLRGKLIIDDTPILVFYIIYMV